MGLFGGFKAKFSRKSANKESVEQIVCTKYRIQSEFLDDAPVVYKHNPRIRLTKPKRPLAKTNDEFDGVPSKQHSKSLSDLNNFEEKTKKNVSSIPSPMHKTESTYFNSASSVSHNSDLIKTQSNDDISHHLFPTIRPPYSKGEKSSRPEVQNDYEEPIESPTSLSKTITEEEVLEELPPLPKTRPPLNLFKKRFVSNEYDEPDENTLEFSSKFELPNNQRVIASSTTVVETNSKKLNNGSFVDNREVIAANSLYLGSPFGQKRTLISTIMDDYEDVTPEETKVTFPSSEKDLEPSTLILMTQPSMESSSFPEATQTNDSFSDYPENDFKINVVKYDHNRNYSMSEDDMSTSELNTEEMNGYTSMGYTSQAASIFFGFEMEPPRPKPRNVVLHRMNEDEEDC